MPIIPRGTEQSRMNVSSPVPVGETTSAGLLGRDVQELGGELQRFASKQIEFDRSLRKQEGASAFENIAKEADDYARRTSNATGTDYIEKMQEYSQKKIPDVYNKYGGDLEVDNHLKSFQKRVEGDMEAVGIIKGAHKSEAFNFDRTQGMINQFATQAAQNPASVPASMQSFNAFLSELETKQVMGADNIIKLRSSFYTEMAMGKALGFSNRKDYIGGLNYLKGQQQSPEDGGQIDPQMALRLGLTDPKTADGLDATGSKFNLPVTKDSMGKQMSPEDSLILSQMNPVARAHLIDQMRSKRKEDSYMKLSDIELKKKGIENEAFRGNDSPKEKAQMLKDINRNEHITSMHKAILADDVITYGEVARTVKKLESATPEERSELVNGFLDRVAASSEQESKFNPSMRGFNNDIAIIGRRDDVLKKLTTAIKQGETKMKQDPKDFALKNTDIKSSFEIANQEKDPAMMNQAIGSLKAYNKRMGLEDRILTNNEVLANVNLIKMIDDPREASDKINEWRDLYGQNFNQFMGELAKKEPSVKDYQLVGMVPKEVQGDVMALVKGEKSIAKALNDPANKLQMVRVKQADMLIEQKLSVFKNVVSGSTNDTSAQDLYNSMKKVLVLHANDGIFNGDTSGPLLLKRVQDGYDKVIGKTFEPITGGPSSILLRKEIDGVPINKGNTQAFLRAYNNPEAMNELNLHIPKGQDPATYYDSISNKSKWVMNHDMTGIRLVEIMGDGTIQPLYNKSKQPITKSFLDMNTPTERTRVELNKRSFWSRQ